jgi:hypothetical protein
LGAQYAGIDDGTQSAARGSSSSQEASDAPKTSPEGETRLTGLLKGLAGPF